MTVKRGFGYNFYFFIEIRGELRTNVTENQVKFKCSGRSQTIEKNDNKLKLSLMF